MRAVLTITFFICMFPGAYGQEPSNPEVPLMHVSKFDEWGDIAFNEEKARLDYVALQWRRNPQSIIYLVIYAGQQSCVGEAKSRGIRARKYLMKRQVPQKHMFWIDGGWWEEVTTQVWILPRELEKPSVFPDLKPNEVKLEKNCKIKRRRRLNV